MAVWLSASNASLGPDYEQGRAFALDIILRK
jgi:hypothetical protein